MGSRVPDVIDALVVLGNAETKAELAGVVVADGPEVTDDDAPDWLIIGFDGDPAGDMQAAQTLGGWSGLGTRREEQFQITVAAIAARGDGDVPAARKRAYEIGARVEAWLSKDPTLGLPELEAAIEASQLTQDQTDDGVQALLLLTVAGRAFT
ncbi:hypothetical protein [Streptomyces sp. TRM68416]|uniref:hypothetical protein n=1 Tax=Streptomyces sp. TRM68416 TaxID=2758412 RepID=UPI001661DFBE|nr:hypothetical protein [Streptomyces sp. TRM68416]MBD0837372.1 hypothetical protein [Streptomyces sp. TRM68416]